MVVRSTQSITENLNTLAVAVLEITTDELRSNLTVFLTLSICKLCVAQIPNLQRVVASSRQSFKQHFNALAVVVPEILPVN